MARATARVGVDRHAIHRDVIDPRALETLATTHGVDTGSLLRQVRRQGN